MGVFGIALAGFIILEFEGWIDFIPNDFREGSDVDVVRRAHVEDLAVGAVGLEQLFVDPDDVFDVGEVAGLGAVAIDDWRFTVETSRDEVRHRHVRPHPRAIDGEVAQRNGWISLYTRAYCSLTNFETP